MKQNSSAPSIIHHHISNHNQKFLMVGIFGGLLLAAALFFKLRFPVVEITEEQKTSAVSQNFDQNFKFLEQKASAFPESQTSAPK